MPGRVIRDYIPKWTESKKAIQWLGSYSYRCYSSWSRKVPDLKNGFSDLQGTWYNQKWGPAVCPSKAIKGGSLVERNACFILYAGNLQREQTPIQKPPPSPVSQWTRAFLDRGRGPCAEAAQSALTVLLKLVICDLTSIILLKYSSSSVCFHFLETISWNCGSLHHGYSLVIM